MAGRDPAFPLSRLAAFEAACVDVVEVVVKAADPFVDEAVVKAAMDCAKGVVRPILVGIGTSQPDQIRHAIDTGADGIVVGSMAIEKGLQSHAALEDYLCEVREVLDGDG